MLTFASLKWRYSAVGIICATLGVMLTLLVFRPTNRRDSGPQLNPDAFVNITALGEDGRVLKENRGVVMDARGYIASNLTTISGAATLRVVQRNGKTYHIDKVWADENRNLAVLKLDTDSVPALPLSTIKQLVGKNLFIVTDPANATKGMTESIVSDFHQIPGRRSDRPKHYIEIATLTTHATGGVLVDEQ